MLRKALYIINFIKNKANINRFLNIFNGSKNKKLYFKFGQFLIKFLVIQ